MSPPLLARRDVPAWIDSLLTDVAMAVGTGALVTYFVLVVPDPEPLVALPTVLTLEPYVWLWVSLALLSFPVFRLVRAGERVVRWWDEHVA